MTAPTAQFDGIWLQSRNYAVVPLNSQLAGRISEFERAIQRGVPASPDKHRHDFYDVELENGWAYVHVRDDAQTVYLVAYSCSQVRCVDQNAQFFRNGPATKSGDSAGDAAGRIPGACVQTSLS